MASERPPIMVQRRGEFLVPQAPVDGERIRDLPAGKALKVTVSQPRRSSAQNRLYWSLLGVVCENLDQDIEPEALHAWLKVKLGVVTPLILRSGEIAYVPGSIAFDKMEHPAFTAYFDRVKALITEHLIPGLNSAALEREAYAMLGETPPTARAA
jgi:hypothetical protein